MKVVSIQTRSLIRRHRELAKAVTHDFKTTERKETGVDKRGRCDICSSSSATSFACKLWAWDYGRLRLLNVECVSYH